MNQTLKKHVNDHQTDWAEHLPMVTFALRTAISSHTGTSPLYAMTGQEPRCPLERQVGATLGNTAICRDNIAHFIQSFKAARQAQYDYILRIQRNSKKYFDKRAKDRSFNVNDIVLMHDPSVPRGLSKKLTKSWRGPYIITYRSDNGRYYKLRSASTGKITTTTGIQRLKPCYLPRENATRTKFLEASINNLPRLDSRHALPDAPAQIPGINPRSIDLSDISEDNVSEHNTDEETDASAKSTAQDTPCTRDPLVQLHDILRLTNIKSSAKRTLYCLLLKGAKLPKWFHADQVVQLPQFMIDDILTKRTLRGLPRRSYVKNRRKRQN